ncbi:MAG: hypothetical protein HQM08_16410 [Candidatus Riflebacteria bacterium]|nr:hypothetical protein [Candidatus Riflebacteria bacterium]
MKKRRNLIFFLIGFLMIFSSTGCIQEALVIPVATVTGKIIPPPGQSPLGVKIIVAGNSGLSTYVNENAQYQLQLPKTGRFLLIARGSSYDADFVWVDAVLEQSVAAPDIALSQKIVGEGVWLGTLVDFPDATTFAVKSLDPVWGTSTAPLYGQVWATGTIPLYDDGSHGDKYAHDGIYTNRLANLPTGSQLYSLLWNGPSTNTATPTVVADPNAESTRIGKSELIIKAPSMDVARGKVTSTLTGVNYSEVVLSTKAGARKIFVNSDGTYSMAMEGNGREYLVFRSPNFHIRAIPVDLTTMPLYDVPDTVLAAKAAGEVKFVLIRSDFQDMKNPAVVADFTNWQPQALYDDGTHGDEVAGDGVYTVTMTNVAPGYHKYAFNLTDTSQVKDPYEESGDSQYSIISVK